MSKLIFTDIPTDDNANASYSKVPGILTPSTTKKGRKRNPAKVSFAKAIITKLTTNISPSNTPTSQLNQGNNDDKDEDDDDTPQIFLMGLCQTRIGGTTTNSRQQTTNKDTW